MLLLPISDDNPTQRRPVLTQAILAINIAVWFVGFVTGTGEDIFRTFGLVPAEFSFLKLFTSQFIHAGFFHLAGNMLFFWIFADNVEDRLGRGWFLLMYLGSGAVGDIAHCLSVAGTETAHIPLGGASGCISGVLAAYLIFYPNQPVRIFYLILLYPGFFSVRALWVIGVFAAQQVLMIMVSKGHDSVAYWAHLGGFGAGLAFALADRWKRGLPEEILPAGEGWRRRVGPQPSTATRIWKRLGPETAVPPPRRPDLPPIEVPYLRAATGWTVLRADDSITDVSAVASLVSRITGEPAAEASRRIRATRGVVARGLAGGTAQRLVDAVRAAGGPAVFAVDEAAAGSLPPPAAAASAAAGPDGFVFEMADGGTWAVPWARVAAVYVARLDRRADSPGAAGLTERFIETTLVDVVTRDPEGRIRLAQDTERFGASAPQSCTREMQAFCSSILQFRGSVPVNNGVSVAAGRGNWGYLRFAAEGDYEDYAWWLTQLIRARSANR